MSKVFAEALRIPGTLLLRCGLRLHLWNALLAVSTGMSASMVLAGRTVPTQASLRWALTFALVSAATMLWLTLFSVRLASRGQYRRGGLLRVVAAVEGPLLALSIGICLSVYVSDHVHHHTRFLLYPLPAIILILAALATVVAQEEVLNRATGGVRVGLRATLGEAARWAVPASLLLLGLLQGTSYIWVIGNDFTRYWAVADAIAQGAGYPASVHQPTYIAAGMSRYSIELPVFPLILLLSFSILGHNTLAAHMPGLLANTVLPLLLFAFYIRAGLARPLAFAASCVVTLFPFFRLYTLNTPLPDPVFLVLLVATGYLFLELVARFEVRGARPTADRGRGEGTGHRAQGTRRRIWEPRTQNSEPRTPRGLRTQDPGPSTQHAARSTQHAALRTPHPALRTWAAFGLLAGLTSLTRPEGLLFTGMMFIGLAPHLLGRRLYLAAAIFLATVAPFVLVMVNVFGTPWPRNVGTALALHHMAANLEWLNRYSLRWYAGALGISSYTFLLVVVLLTVAFVLGTAWIARRRWPVALLPAAAGLHVALVFAVDPRTSGADQWFDFFRHVSYGIPFALLPVFLLGERVLAFLGWCCRLLAGALASKCAPVQNGAALRVSPAMVAAVLALTFSAYELRLLAFPARSMGTGATQLLTSDVWIGFPKIAAHPHPLPMLTFAQSEGMLMIDPRSEYMPRHLPTVRRFFEPISSLRTGRGTGYQLSSLPVILFGFCFVVATASDTFTDRRHGRNRVRWREGEASPDAEQPLPDRE